MSHALSRHLNSRPLCHMYSPDQRTVPYSPPLPTRTPLSLQFSQISPTSSGGRGSRVAYGDEMLPKATVSSLCHLVLRPLLLLVFGYISIQIWREKATHGGGSNGCYLTLLLTSSTPNMRPFPLTSPTTSNSSLSFNSSFTSTSPTRAEFAWVPSSSIT